MRIDGNGRPGGIGPRSNANRGSNSGPVFRAEEGATTARASSAGPVAMNGSIDALLALQAVEDPLFARKKAVRRGTSLLDTLEEIKADLLIGRVSEGRLNQLMAVVGQAREMSHPGLDALLDDIELRARVELAKFGRYPS